MLLSLNVPHPPFPLPAASPSLFYMSASPLLEWPRFELIGCGRCNTIASFSLSLTKAWQALLVLLGSLELLHQWSSHPARDIPWQGNVERKRETGRENQSFSWPSGPQPSSQPYPNPDEWARPPECSHSTCLWIHLISVEPRQPTESWQVIKFFFSFKI